MTIWAAQDGQGTTCSQAAPCSLTTAQAQADVLAPTIRGDVTVYLLAGLYRLGQPLTFTAHDSGVNGHNIIYAGDTTPPIISGSIAISGWSLANSAQNIWSAPVPASLTTRQLYVNGVRAQIAQGSPPVMLTQDAGHAGFTASSDAMASWRNPSNLEFVFPGGDGAWTEPRCRVASMSGTSIIMQQPCWGNTLNRNPSASGGFVSLSSQAVPARIENAYELLSQPGQWYLDTSLHTLYYIPLPGQDMQQADVEAPVLQTLVQGNGTLDAPVNHLIFRNLQFSYATWLGPDSTNGFSEMQANYFLTGTNAGQNQGLCEYVTPAGSCPFASWAQTPANVTFSASQDVQFDSDIFTHLGGAGLGFQYGSQNNLVINSEFTDISGSGLQLGNDNDPHPSDVGANNREITSSNTIKDNWFHNVATEYHGGVGIFVGYAQHTLITHNQLNDLPYSGISFGWGGWNTNATHQTAETNVNAYNVISYNVIFDYTRTLADGGGIYTNGRQGTSFTDGLQEIGNILFDQYHSSNAFYNDGGSAYVTLKGNAEWSGQTAWGGCSAVGHFLYENNYQSGGLNGFGNCQVPVDITTSQNTHIDNPPAPGKVPSTLLASAGIEPSYTSLVMPGGPQVVDYGPDTGTMTAPHQCTDQWHWFYPWRYSAVFWRNGQQGHSPFTQCSHRHASKQDKPANYSHCEH
ncbi:MAG TPA: right-handed parallel beta-helix repeat-containing protein [Ktedonobacteraceae bacterium]